MRVLMLSDVYFPRVNGVSTSIETFRGALARLGVEVRLIAPRYADEADSGGVTRIAGRPVPRDPEDRLMAWSELRAKVEREAADSDLIHVQTPFLAHYAGINAARRLAKPVLATYHTLFEEYLHHYAPFMPANWLKGMARRFSRAQCNDLDAVVVPSSAMRDRLAEYGVVAPMHVLPTGIPLQRFAAGDRARFRAQHGIAPEQPAALFVGRVAYEKNIGFLMESLAIARRQQPNLILLVTGEGPASESLKRQAHTLGLAESVRFLGYLDRKQDLPDCYAAADVFVFASRTETQGLVLLEAMAMGLPVVGLSAMGTRDILEPGRGSLAPPDDPDEFSRVLLSLLSDGARRERLGEEARAFAQEWSDDHMAERLLGLYRELLGRTAPYAGTQTGGARRLASG
jgi:glycosyltransferase involved in cell wall biosynthesis